MLTKRILAVVLSIAVSLSSAVGFPILAQSQDHSSEQTPALGKGFVGAGNVCSIGVWNTVAPLNTARSRLAGAYSEVTGNFYVLAGEASGGNRDLPIEEYSVSSNAWFDRTSLLTGVSNTDAAAVGDYIYVPGGFTGTEGTDAMQRFDPVANTVNEMAAMPAANYAHAVVALDEKIHVLGGDANGAAGAIHYVYDVATNSWDTEAAVPTPVHYAAAVSDGTYVYLLGGNVTDLDLVQRYDPATNTWDTIDPMLTGRGGGGAFFDGRNIWAVGGGWSTYETSAEYNDGTNWTAGPGLNVGARTIAVAYGNGMALKAGGWNGTFAADAEILEVVCPVPPSTCEVGGWVPVAPLNTARSRLAGAYSEVTGNFYVLAGEASGGNRDLPIEEYSVSSNAWFDRTSLLTGVSNTDAAAVGDYIYVPGGFTGTEGTDAMQRFDPVTNTVNEMAAMPAANHAHAVVALDERIHVLGGDANGAAGAIHYVYDVATNSWDTEAAVPTPVHYAAAVSDGTYVYLLGGNVTDLDLVQRYDPATNTWDTIDPMLTGRGGGGAFFDGRNIWAVGGGWSTYETSAEYNDQFDWFIAPFLNVGARTIAVAYGNRMALKAGGWNGTFAADAEIINIDCRGDMVFADRFET